MSKMSESRGDKKKGMVDISNVLMTLRRKISKELWDWRPVKMSWDHNAGREGAIDRILVRRKKRNGVCKVTKFCFTTWVSNFVWWPPLMRPLVLPKECWMWTYPLLFALSAPRTWTEPVFYNRGRILLEFSSSREET